MTVLDVVGWAMAAAPYVPAVVITGVLAVAVYGARHTARCVRERRAERAARRISEHPLVRRYHDGPDDAGTLAQLDAELDRRIAHINLHDREEGRS
jgi:hypothetical protein